MSIKLPPIGSFWFVVRTYDPRPRGKPVDEAIEVMVLAHNAERGRLLGVYSGGSTGWFAPGELFTKEAALALVDERNAQREAERRAQNEALIARVEARDLAEKREKYEELKKFFEGGE